MKTAVPASMFRVSILIVGFLLAVIMLEPTVAQGGTPYQDDVRPPSVPGETAEGAPEVTPRAGGAAFWRRIRQGESGNALVIDRKSATLIQVEGERWRQALTGTVKSFGAWLALLSIVAVSGLYVTRGRTQVEGRGKRKRVQRLTRLQRYAHWATALSFLVLALTGLNLMYGRQFLMPLLGADAFAQLTLIGKYAHNFMGIVFVVGVLMLAVVWLPGSGVAAEFRQKHGGSKAKDKVVGKFSWPQKLSWALFVLGGVLMGVSGAALLFPFGFEGLSYAGLARMHQIQLGHSVLGLLLMAAVLWHVYLDAVSKHGSLGAVISGYVSEAWARQHHAGWLRAIRLGQANRAGPVDPPPTQAAASGKEKP